MLKQIVWLIMLCFCSLHADTHELGSYERIEDIGEYSFKVKLFFDNNELIQDFFVNDESVNQKTFHERLISAHEQELHNVQQRLKTVVHQEFQQIYMLRKEGYFTLIKQVREFLQNINKKIQEEQLQPFFAFSEENVDSIDTLKKIQEQLLPSLSFVDEEGVLNESIDQLKNLFEQLEELYKLLIQFYENTLTRALEKSDNPSHLKQLLELTS